MSASNAYPYDVRSQRWECMYLMMRLWLGKRNG